MSLDHRLYVEDFWDASRVFSADSSPEVQVPAAAETKRSQYGLVKLYSFNHIKGPHIM